MSSPTFEWSGSKRSDHSVIVIASDEKIHFAKDGFASAIEVDTYQDDTWEELNNTSAGQELHNIKYVNGSQYSLDDAGNAILNGLNTSDCFKVKLTVDALAFTTLNSKLIAFNSSTITAGPVEVTAQGFERTNTSWKNISGSGAALVLAAQANSSTEHDWFFGLSAKPVEIGSKSLFAYRIVTDYQ